MKNLSPDYYPPLARKAKIFLDAAQKSQEITNRYCGFWEVSYYLISHAIELSIKATIKQDIGLDAEKTHDLEELAIQYQSVCSFANAELQTIKALNELNDGPGGLRYDNKPKGQFLPSTFSEGVNIVEKLLEGFEDALSAHDSTEEEIKIVDTLGSKE